MAKKRRLSKRDRKLKTIKQLAKKWALLFRDEDFLERVRLSIQDIDPTFSGYIAPKMKTLMYFVHNGKEIVASYEVAVLTDEGYFVYSRPYSDSEVPF